MLLSHSLQKSILHDAQRKGIGEGWEIDFRLPTTADD
jgi:hypothetical protein